ncbi:hypothetical protein D3C71_2115400 [compost metagenome]
MAQYYHLPMWKVPDLLKEGRIETQHINTIRGAGGKYRSTGNAYRAFCQDLISRIELLG